MVSIKIYIEGGGEGKHLEIGFLRAWSKFFQAAGLQGRMPRVVRGKGRKNTYDLFCTALKHSKPGEIPLLLLDSEGAVNEEHKIWQHLNSHSDDRFEQPAKATEAHAYLMVQVMETWLLADLDALKSHFGSQFKPDKIPAWKELETQHKSEVFAALEKATAACTQPYAKGKVSFEVLAKIDPKKVKERCPNARRLLDFLAQKR